MKHLIVQLWSLLSLKEQKNFIDWLVFKKYSPLHQEVARYLLKHPKASLQEWEEQSTLAKGYQATTFRKIKSDLTQALKGYCSYLKFSSSSHEEPQNYLNFLASKQQQHLIQVELNTYEYPLKAHFLNEYQLELLKLKHIHIPQRKPTTNLEACVHHLNLYYHQEYLYLISIRCSHHLLYQSKVILSDEEQHILEQSAFFNEPSMQRLRSTIFCLLGNLEYFQALKQELLHLNPSDYQDLEQHIFLLTLNVAIHQGNKNEMLYKQDALALFQYGLQHHILFSEGNLNPIIYRNAITLAIQSQEFTWASEAIEQYKNELPLEHQEPYYCFCKAKLLFEQGSYKGVLNLLSKVEFNDIFITLNTKALLLKSYYELNYYEGLELLLDSFKSYLKRHVKATHYQVYFGNFIHFLNMLYLAKPSSNLKEMYKQLSEEQTVSSKEWLLMKLDLKLQQGTL